MQVVITLKSRYCGLKVKCLIIVGLFCTCPYYPRAQQLEPRAYAALPKNFNAIVFAYGLSRGNVLADPALPITNFTITTNTFSATFLHTFEVAKKLARVQVTIPYADLLGKLQINGHDTSGGRSGLADAEVRIGVNLTGSPPLDKKAFTHYTQQTIVGTSLVISVPTGLYYADKRINIGSHRWGIKPEVGISQRIKRIYFEAYAGIWFYTLNNDYLGKNTIRQDPVFNLQLHGSYYFKNFMWISINSVWFIGGQTKIDDVPQGALLNNWRAGATWGIPIARGQSLKLQFHVGVLAAGHYNYNLAMLAYQHTF
jgi:hypothetical protein